MSHVRTLLCAALLVSLFCVPGFAEDMEPTGMLGSTYPRGSGGLETQELAASAPTIWVNRSKLNFGAVAGGTHTEPETLMIGNSGGGTLHWSAAASETWLQITPLSGTGEDTIAMGVGLDLTGMAPDVYTATITISDPSATNSPFVVDVYLVIHEDDHACFGSFQTPVDGSVVRGMVRVTGWALDDIQVSGVTVYRRSGDDLVYVGPATFVDGARPDVHHAYPNYPGNYRAGWTYTLWTHLLPSGGNGVYTLEVVAEDSSGHRVTLGRKTITADNANAVKPFGEIDTPTRGGVASGSAFINWGWVLTPLPGTIPVDGSTINVYVDGVFVGHPQYNIYRSDIAALFPAYSNSNGAVGYYSLDTTRYANGIHTMQWTARDDQGNTDGIGSRYFTIVNPPLVQTWVTSAFVDDDFDGTTPGWDVDHFALMQDGIDAVISGGSVRVAAGTYSESVMLDRYVDVVLDGDIVLGDLSISTGTFVASNGNLLVCGDFTHSGGVFDPGDRMVTFDGSMPQTISGDTAFFDLTVGSLTTLATTDNVVVNGTLVNHGVTRETKVISGLGPTTFGLADVTIDVTQAGLTSLEVERRDQDHPGAPMGVQTGKYWSFAPDGDGYVLSMTLPHDRVPSACDEVCRFDDQSGTWDCCAHSYDAGEATITRDGITQLSDWATGEDTGPCHFSLPMVFR